MSRSQLYIFSKRHQKFCKTYQYLKVDGTNYATIFFGKIDQIQVVWEMRIFYYCIPCLRAESKQKDDRTIVYYRGRSSFCVDVSGHAKQRNFSSVMLKINKDKEESVSSTVYKYDTSTP